MNLEVGNVSCTGADVSWSPAEPCLGEFYYVAYRPSWHSTFSGYLQYRPEHDEMVPSNLNSLSLRHLTPATLYFLCISCRRVGVNNPRHCTLFHTLEQTPPEPEGTLDDPHFWLWVLMAALLACFTAIMAFVCLQLWRICCQEPRWAYQAGHVEEVNGLVRWLEEVPALGQLEEDLPDLLLEEDLPDLPLDELEHEDLDLVAAMVAAMAEEANQEVPLAGAPAEGAYGARRGERGPAARVRVLQHPVPAEP